MAVGRGQQDPAKHQLLAAFFTDIRRAGHIYATASSRLKLKHHSALIAWIIRLPPAVFSDCLPPNPPPPSAAFAEQYTLIYQSLCHGRVGAAYLLLLLDGGKRLLTVPDGCFTQLACSGSSLSADREQVHLPQSHFPQCCSHRYEMLVFSVVPHRYCCCHGFASDVKAFFGADVAAAWNNKSA